ncbi:unnamed protein product, partial [Oppiella nova]
MEKYGQMYKKSINDPASYWSDMAKDFVFKYSEQRVLKFNFDILKGPISIKFMEGALTNVCYNILDRNINKGLGHHIAYYWEGNEPDTRRQINYHNLLREVCKFANVLKSLGIQMGDTIAIYMPNSIELVTAMLGCARIGAIHTVVFAGFSAEALADRIIDANCVMLITCDGAYRGTKFIPLKGIADLAITLCNKSGHSIKACIVKRHVDINYQDEMNNKCSHLLIKWDHKVDIWWHEALEMADDYCAPVWLDTEHPLFILYTSGSTGKPKGVVHSTGGYMIYTATTFKYVFNHTDGDVFFCTADLGWITGHTASVYGALANGATVVLLEGTPFHPNPDRLWQLIDDLRVNTFYTAPTVIRSLMKFGDKYVQKYKLSSLKLLGTAGEPINPEAWHWFYIIIGKGNCPI